MYSMILFDKLISGALDATSTPESAVINDFYQHQHTLDEVPKKRSGQSWYAGLSDEKKAEHLKKLRMSRLQKNTATSGINVNVQESSAPHNLPCMSMYLLNCYSCFDL